MDRVDLLRVLQGADAAGLHAAGGIGGLLAMAITQGTANESDDKYCIYFYNANGDIGQLIDTSNGTTAARYEYYFYGGPLVETGSAATVNPFRFSTKYWDEWQAYYYGYRYHKPRIGRWLSRDVVHEDDGWLLYRAFRNSPTFIFDPRGDTILYCGKWTLADGTVLDLTTLVQQGMNLACARIKSLSG